MPKSKKESVTLESTEVAKKLSSSEPEGLAKRTKVEEEGEQVPDVSDKAKDDNAPITPSIQEADPWVLLDKIETLTSANTKLKNKLTKKRKDLSELEQIGEDHLKIISTYEENHASQQVTIKAQGDALEQLKNLTNVQREYIETLKKESKAFKRANALYEKYVEALEVKQEDLKKDIEDSDKRAEEARKDFEEAKNITRKQALALHSASKAYVEFLSASAADVAAAQDSPEVREMKRLIAEKSKQ